MGLGYILDWTVWRVWLHPHRARRALGVAKDMEDDLTRRLSEALDLLEAQRKETSRVTLESADLCRRLADRDAELAEVRRELAETQSLLLKAQESLEEHESIEVQLAEFHKQLSKVEEMKRNYEKRISNLESRLKDARTRLSEKDDDELLEPIDMTAPLSSSNVIGPKSRRPQSVPAPRGYDGQPVHMPSAEALPAKEKKPEDKKMPDPANASRDRKSSDDDWLMELPEDL